MTYSRIILKTRMNEWKQHTHTALRYLQRNRLFHTADIWSGVGDEDETLRKFISESSRPLSEQSEGMWQPESRGRLLRSVTPLSPGVSDPRCRSRPPVRITNKTHVCSWALLSTRTTSERALVSTLVRFCCCVAFPLLPFNWSDGISPVPDRIYLGPATEPATGSKPGPC